MSRIYFATRMSGVREATPLLFCQECYGYVHSNDGVTCSVCGTKKRNAALTIKRIVAPLCLITSLCVQASDCPDMYLAHHEPQLIAPLAGRVYELCNAEYAVLISEVNKTALYAAEKLTPARMKGAKKIKRGENEFFEDYRLPEEVRVSTYSYTHTGYDRGHLAPAGDFSTMGAQRESFSLANVVPQSSTVNRGIWADIESTVRHLAKKGTTHVVTGPLYLGPTTYLPKGGIPVPSHLFKAVYAPASNVVGVYVVGNKSDGRIAKLSLDEFSNMTGINVFPGLPSEVKMFKGAVPSPMSRERGSWSK